jgi:hypothetical protein
MGLSFCGLSLLAACSDDINPVPLSEVDGQHTDDPMSPDPSASAMGTDIPLVPGMPTAGGPAPITPGDPAGTPPPVTPGAPAPTPGTPPGSPPGTPVPGTATPPTPVEMPAPIAACTNTDTTMLPIDETGWVARNCNDPEIQGSFYCYHDGQSPTSCMDGVVPFIAGRGMCITGSTIEDPGGTEYAFGAGIGLSLNDSGETETMASVKSAYDATAHGITGFHIVLTGTSGVPIRIGFTGAAESSSIAPFVEFPMPGDTPVEFTAAMVPSTWDVDNAGETVDPAAIFDLQVQVSGGAVAADYDLCIQSITPITDGSVPVPSPGGALASQGACQTGEFAEIVLGASYMVQNNAYNGGSHCIEALWDGGTNAGFNLTGVNANAAEAGPPASYPSVVYGWHVNGRFYGGYAQAQQLSAITSVPSNWTFSVPNAGRYNASYDNWLHATAAPANEQGSLEHMIWLNDRDGATPIGSNVGSIDLAGAQWEVWYGQNNGWNTVTYRRRPVTSSVTDFDLMPFFEDSVTRGYAQSSDYLLGIQAGFEIWVGNQEEFSIETWCRANAGNSYSIPGGGRSHSWPGLAVAIAPARPVNVRVWQSRDSGVGALSAGSTRTKTRRYPALGTHTPALPTMLLTPSSSKGSHSRSG